MARCCQLPGSRLWHQTDLGWHPESATWELDQLLSSSEPPFSISAEGLTKDGEVGVEKHLTQCLTHRFSIHRNSDCYYLCGPKQVIESLSLGLLTLKMEVVLLPSSQYSLKD